MTNKKYLSGMQTVQSMRSSGYKSTDYAVAELIDNSIQARATDVIIAVVERVSIANVRKTSKAHEIWVLDNGRGMEPDLAEDAVSFGGSDRYDDRSGMGRFGMGLPQASVSQCLRTDVWTWQDSDPRDAAAVRIDLDEIEQGIDEVPAALHPGDIEYEPLPEWVLHIYENHIGRTTVAGHEATPSGTAIRWNKLDRVRWTKGDTIIDHVEFLLGRIYRRFLTGEARDAETGEPMKARIQILVLQDEDIQAGKVDVEPRTVRPNDPMHLSTPKEDVLEYFERGNPDFAPKASSDENVDEDGNRIPPLIAVYDRPPFEQFHPPKLIPVHDRDGVEHQVLVRTSRATDEGRPATVQHPGADTHQGPHFARNRGVSIMRADREVCMDETYYYDAPDRFWSVEVSFPPALDERFGVTNNKQDVPHFKELSREVARRSQEPETPSLVESGDIDPDHGFAELEKVAKYVRTQVGTMRTLNKNEHKTRKTNAHQRLGKASTPTVHTTVQVKRELGVDHPTPGEREAQEDKDKSPEERERAQQERAEQAKQSAIDNGVSPDDAEAVANNYMKGLNYQPVDVRQPQAPAFFWPDEHGDLEIVYLNTGHPAHEGLLETLRLEDDKITALSEEEAKALLGKAADALGWLIHGWARMEDNHKGSPTHTEVVNTRELWGKQLRAMVESRSFKSARADLGDILRDDEAD